MNGRTSAGRTSAGGTSKGRTSAMQSSLWQTSACRTLMKRTSEGRNSVGRTSTGRTSVERTSAGQSSLWQTSAARTSVEQISTRRSDSTVWCLPGGTVDHGESVAQAAIRESLEETGLQVELTRLVGVYSRPNWWGGGDHALVFTARPIGGRLQRATRETLDARFFDPEQLPKTLLSFHHQRILDAVNNNGTAVAWTQEVAWPFGDLTRDESYELRDQGIISVPKMINLLCGHRKPERERLELGYYPYKETCCQSRKKEEIGGNLMPNNSSNLKARLSILLSRLTLTI